MSPLFLAAHFSAEAREVRMQGPVSSASSKASHSCVLGAGSISIREEGFHQGPALHLMHKFISVLLPSSGQRNCGVWWKWGELSVPQAVHSTPRDVVLRPSLCSTEELPNFSPVQKWHEQGKKGEKSLFLTSYPQNGARS